MRLTVRLSCLLSALAFVVAIPAEPALRRCATLELAQRSLASAPGTYASARLARAQADPLAGRVLYTTHFAIHYTMAPGASGSGVHRPVLDAIQDAVLKTKTDSIVATLSGSLTQYRRDSTLHARLNAISAPHPLFIQRTAQYFERAWSHYDSLGMRMPTKTSVSAVYSTPSSPGRFAVDVADMGSADPDFRNEAYYGLATPPPNSTSSGAILLENDFRYYLNNVLTPMVITLNGQPRNYYEAWDLALQVTVPHEFYHGVQYEYTPQLSNIHSWYELSAVGMEERLAPDVNDYLQYLPYNVRNGYQSSGSILAALSSANYGNGIFHVFLTRKLGPGFDAVVWESLRTGGNNLSTALIAGAGSSARWDSLFSAFAAAMTLSGTPAAATSPLAFSPDMPLWPRPRLDSVPELDTAFLSMAPGTWRIVQAAAFDTSLARFPTLTGGAWRLDSSASGIQTAFLPTGDARFAAAAGGTAFLAVGNSSFIQTRTLRLVWLGQRVTATPNPASRVAASIVFSGAQSVATDTLHILSESGRVVSRRPLAGGGWNWNLKDDQGRTVPAGTYFYRVNTGTPRPLLILP